MITEIEDYFAQGCGRCERFATADCSTRRWIAGLETLRRICRDQGLVETVKWGHPCYMHNGRNVALIGAFRDDFRLTFFHAGLMQDPQRLLERPGPNSANPSMLRFTANEQPAQREPVIRAYLQEAMGFAAAGLEPPRTPAAFELPDELIEALDADPDLAEAFHRLTPGRQRSYAIALGSAKAPATRIARIAKLRDRIIAGKGANER